MHQHVLPKQEYSGRKHEQCMISNAMYVLFQMKIADLLVLNVLQCDIQCDFCRPTIFIIHECGKSYNNCMTFLYVHMYCLSVRPSPIMHVS